MKLVTFITHPCPNCHVDVIAMAEKEVDKVKSTHCGVLKFRIRKGFEHETWCLWYVDNVLDAYASDEP